MTMRVGVLLGTYNGERFLREQLASLARQTCPDWQLLASDDGSRDTTLCILSEFSSVWPGRVHMRSGPGGGFARNFLSMAAAPGFDAPYWAFCDQDDVWHDGKLEHAVAWLETIPPERPGLYCARTELLDAAGKRISLSPNWRRPPHFRNALVQNIGSGNAMVFNEAARQLLVKSWSSSVPFHDWWLYLLVAGCGGSIHFSALPDVGYRLHGANALGPWGGLASWGRRGGILLNGTYRRWVDANLASLSAMASELTDESWAALADFKRMRQARGWRRGAGFVRSGVFHQSTLGHWGLLLAATLGRL